MDPALLLALLNVTPEAELQREIRDIVDELDIILHIAKQQKDMISRFVKFANQIIEADVDKYKPENGLSSSQVATLKLLRQQQSAFKTHSDDLSSEIEDRIQELTGMKESALSTAGNVSVCPCLADELGTDEDSGQRSTQPQAAASQRCSGL